MINKVCSPISRRRIGYSFVNVHKFWNVKIASRAVNSPVVSKEDVNEDPWAEEERRETAASLKEKQVRMEQQVYRVWT